jgi:hypothetical protein
MAGEGLGGGGHATIQTANATDLKGAGAGFANALNCQYPATLVDNLAVKMSAENDNKPLEEVKAPEAKAEETQEVCSTRQRVIPLHEFL